MPEVLITGGAGFIGSHLAEELLHKGYKVRVLDNFLTGKPENLSHLKTDSLEVIEGDVRDKNLVSKAVKGVDFVFHLAALTSVPFSFKNPLLCEEINVLGSLNVVEAALEARVQKLIFSSSSAVYGDVQSLPVLEEERLNPLSPYASSKFSVEKHLEVNKDKLKSVVLRLFNLYGLRQDPNSEYAAAIPRFIERIKRGENIVIYGDGEQTRDFLYIKDGVKVFWLAAIKELPSATVMNIGSGERVSINQLAETLKTISGKELKISYAPPRPGDIKHSQADITRAKKLLGFQPQWSLQAGLREVFQSWA